MANRINTWSDIREKCLIYEDEQILVLNKPVGISVVGDFQGADLMSLAKASNEKLSPVHRIDKETSGAIILAKNPKAHAELTRQFNKRTVNKLYLAIVSPGGICQKGIIDLPLSLGRKNKVRVAAKREDILYDIIAGRWYVDQDKVLTNVKTYPSMTEFVKVQENRDQTLLIVKPLTGRRHQIRVDLAWIGYPIVGDPLFKNPKTSARTYLHSWRLEFDASWKNNESICVEAVPDNSFWKPLSTNSEQKKEIYEQVSNMMLEFGIFCGINDTSLRSFSAGASLENNT